MPFIGYAYLQKPVFLCCFVILPIISDFWLIVKKGVFFFNHLSRFLRLFDMSECFCFLPLSFHKNDEISYQAVEHRYFILYSLPLGLLWKDYGQGWHCLQFTSTCFKFPYLMGELIVLQGFKMDICSFFFFLFGLNW